MNVSVDLLDVSFDTYVQQYRQGFLTGPDAPPNGKVYSEQPAVINGVQAYVMVVGYGTTQGCRVKGKTAVIPGD